MPGKPHAVGKKDLINAIVELGAERWAAEMVYDRLMSTISERLASGDIVRLPEIGTFTPIFCPARQGRNPATGAPLDIPARVGVRFKAAAPLRRALNPEPEMED